MNKKKYAIGLMSGTSMDGVDAALIETDGGDFLHLIESVTLKYSKKMQNALKMVEKTIAYQKGIFQFDQKINDDGLLIQDVVKESTKLHCLAVDELLKKHAIKDAIVGYHGQTFYHQPEKGVSIILGDPQFLSNQFKMRVIFNFRENDMKHGGKGAPLAPIYHHFLALKLGKIPSAFVNCGGISNVTYIQSSNENDMVAFDVGPGNVLIDRFVKYKTNNKVMMDEDGLFGKQGKIHPHILDLLWEKSCLKKDFYKRTPPKALDVADFILPDEVLDLSLEDGCLTLADFTAQVIAKSIHFIDKSPINWIVAGGGFYNPNIKERLRVHLKKESVQNIILKTADEVGLCLKSLEAQLFGYLAVRSYKGLPLSYPQTTGVLNPITGGDLYHPKS